MLDISVRPARRAHTAHREHARLKKAFSTLETIMATSMVGLMLVVSMNSVAHVARVSSRDGEYVLAVEIAKHLLDEISAHPFEDPVDATGTQGREADELSAARTSWDDCDDYDGWTQSPVRLADGTVLTNWSASVEVVSTSSNFYSATTSAADNLKRITLMLEGPSGKTYEFMTLRARDGNLQQAQPSGSTVLQQISIELPNQNLSVRPLNQQVP